MREFNRDFRGRDAPTDVLTFPSGEVSALDGQLYLGDIAVSVPTAVRQARERGHTLNRELKILVLHGYLHLLGFDHERDGGKMMRLQRRLERKLLRTGGTAPLGRRA
jgi:probable rRNA maturation factor